MRHCMAKCLRHMLTASWQRKRSFQSGDGTERDNISIGKHSLKVFEKLEDIQKSDYAVPKIRNFAAVDSLTAPYLAFSMTVSSDHPTVASGLLNILPALQDRPILVFVVPQEIEVTFREHLSCLLTHLGCWRI